MKPLDLPTVARFAGGTLRNAASCPVVAAVSTDSRTIGMSSLFVPLIGERFDGHEFLTQVLEKGATATLCAASRAGLLPAGLPAVIVDDTLVGLQHLAEAYRLTLEPFIAIGVTGSNGKTSTKDFLTSVVSRRHAVTATRGNLNNHIGLPLTVLSTEAHHTAGVWEMGINHFGEMAPLARIAKPNVAVITGIGTAHIEFLESREGIAREKGVLAEAVSADGFVVLNADDDMTPSLAKRCRARIVTAGLTGGDVRGRPGAEPGVFTLIHAGREIDVKLPVPGRHMVTNALLAAAVGLNLGSDLDTVASGLEATRLHGGRLERRRAGGLHWLDDSYNANPDSMKAALATLAGERVTGRRIAILGRMGELGPHSAEGHRSVGKAAAEAGIDVLLTVGEDHSVLIHGAFDRPAASHHFSSHDDAAAWLRREATADDLILVKGSRSARMERVISTFVTP